MSLMERSPPSHWKGPPVEGGGEPPYDDGMEARVAALEKDVKDVRERTIKIEAILESYKSIFASKSDVAEAKSSIILWVVTAVLFAQFLPGILKRFGIF